MRASMDEIGEALQNTLAALRREFPDALVHEVSLNVCAGARSDHNDPQDWVRVRWDVQVGNTRGNGASLHEALAELHENIEQVARVRQNAEVLAAAMRKVPEDNFERSRTVSLAQDILESERRRSR